jgi:hypothetical protein
MLKPPSPQSAITCRERSSALDTVGLTERRSDRSVVEGTENPLRSALPYPVGRPERVEAGVQYEDRAALGEIADHARHRLRMYAIRAAAKVRLAIQHVIPFPPLPCDAIPKLPAALCLDPIAEQVQRRPHRADDAERRLGSASERLWPLVDLNDHSHAGQEL